MPLDTRSSLLCSLWAQHCCFVGRFRLSLPFRRFSQAWSVPERNDREAIQESKNGTEVSVPGSELRFCFLRTSSVTRFCYANQTTFELSSTQDLESIFRAPDFITAYTISCIFNVRPWLDTRGVTEYLISSLCMVQMANIYLIFQPL